MSSLQDVVSVCLNISTPTRKKWAKKKNVWLMYYFFLFFISVKLATLEIISHPLPHPIHRRLEIIESILVIVIGSTARTWLGNSLSLNF